jgi:hypothetical protein
MTDAAPPPPPDPIPLDLRALLDGRSLADLKPFRRGRRLYFHDEFRYRDETGQVVTEPVVVTIPMAPELDDGRMDAIRLVSKLAGRPIGTIEEATKTLGADRFDLLETQCIVQRCTFDVKPGPDKDGPPVPFMTLEMLRASMPPSAILDLYNRLDILRAATLPDLGSLSEVDCWRACAAIAKHANLHPLGVMSADMQRAFVVFLCRKLSDALAMLNSSGLSLSTSTPGS